MAHFYGTVSGTKGSASRLGSRKGGLVAVAASWSGAVRVELYDLDGVDMARVALVPWQGKGVSRVLWEGPVSGAGDDATA